MVLVLPRYEENPWDTHISRGFTRIRVADSGGLATNCSRSVGVMQSHELNVAGPDSAALPREPLGYAHLPKSSRVRGCDERSMRGSDGELSRSISPSKRRGATRGRCLARSRSKLLTSHAPMEGRAPGGGDGIQSVVSLFWGRRNHSFCGSTAGPLTRSLDIIARYP